MRADHRRDETLFVGMDFMSMSPISNYGRMREGYFVAASLLRIILVVVLAHRLSPEVERMINHNAKKCVGCGDCLEVCPQQCFIMSDGGKSAHAFADRCMECGACRLNCRSDAISVEAGPG